MKRLRKGFFGKKTGILLDSGSEDSPTVFMTFIKRKEDGSWEKPSVKEGKAIKFSLIDVAFILQVLRGDASVWKTVHYFEGRETHISFERGSGNEEKLTVKVADYIKLLNYGEIEVFKLLLERVFQEKVISSAQVKKQEEPSEYDVETNQTKIEKLPEAKLEPMLMETAILAGVVQGETEKALLIDFEDKKELWVPKSTIHCSFDSNSTKVQKFEIDTWILKKNNLL